MKKILVIRFSSIGDIILTTPILRCLRQQQPDWQIHVLTKKDYASLYLANPNVDRVYSLKSDELHDLIKQLRDEHYDHVVDLHRSIRSRIVTWRLRRPSSSFPKLNLRKFFLVSLGISLMPERHIVGRYFNAVKVLGILNDGEGLDFFFEEGTRNMEQLLPISFQRNYIALANGGRHQTKIIPAEKAIEICQHLGMKVVLLGGEADKARGEEIQKVCSDKVFNGCGLFTLMESARILQAASGVITGDTGLMHIASALKKPIISVWGNTVPAFGMYPYLPNQPGLFLISEVDNLRCRPCSKLGHSVCPEKHFRCMLDQDAQGIADAMKGLIAVHVIR